MPNIFKSILIRRFFAHILEIGTTFSISLILLNILIWFFGLVGIPNIFSQDTGIFINTANKDLSFEGSIFNSLLYTMIAFVIFYFAYTTFNFFFSFITLYPKNNFEASFALKIFGFKKYEFSNKKETHLIRAGRMILRETLIFLSVYGIFIFLVLFKVNFIFEFFNSSLVKDETIGNVFKIGINLFLIFVLPSLVLSLIYMKITKGKQLFWDYYSGITLK